MSCQGLVWVRTLAPEFWTTRVCPGLRWAPWTELHCSPDRVLQMDWVSATESESDDRSMEIFEVKEGGLCDRSDLRLERQGGVQDDTKVVALQR